MTIQPSSDLFKPPPGPVGEVYTLRRDLNRIGEGLQRRELGVIKSINSELDDLGHKELDALDTVSKETRNQNLWSYSTLITSIAYGAFTLLYGMHLYSQKDPQAKKFIRTGLIWLGNALCDHFNIWQRASRYISFGNPTVETVLTIGCPLLINANTINWIFNRLYPSDNEPKKVIQVLDYIAAIVSMLVRVGQTYTLIRKGIAERHLMDIQSQTTLASARLDPLIQHEQFVRDSSDQTSSILKGAIVKFVQKNAALAAQ